MDITLQRILSLLPTKPDGKIVRGAKKDFAMNIGYESGDIVSQWIKGESTSYKNKLHEIAIKYDVSVEWLRGEIDEKRPAIVSNDEPLRGNVNDLLTQLSSVELEKVDAFVKGLLASR